MAHIVQNGKIDGLPEHVDFKTLCDGIKRVTGISLVPRKFLKFKQAEYKKYAYVQNCFSSEEGCCMTFTAANMLRVKAALNLI